MRLIIGQDIGVGFRPPVGQADYLGMNIGRHPGLEGDTPLGRLHGYRLAIGDIKLRRRLRVNLRQRLGGQLAEAGDMAVL